MTTSTTPPSTTIRINQPGELIAAIPALLGFVPHRSIVVFCMEGSAANRIGLVIRVDLPDPRATDPAATDAVVEQLSTLWARRETPAIMAVVVEDRGPKTELVHRELLGSVREACAAVGVAFLGAHAIDHVTAGSCWRGYDEGAARSGLLGDPRSSTVSAAHVAQGRVIHGARAELDELLRRDPEAALERRATLVDAAVDAAGSARELAGPGAVRADLEAVLAAVARVGEQERLFDEEIARLGAALSDPLVRDACFGLALGEHADDAQSLWLQLCRGLPDPQRAQAAVLVAYSSYVQGEGPLAGIALQAALASMPDHRMASLLDAALSGGLAPEEIRALADTSLDIAADLGVALVPFTAPPDAQ